MAIKSPCILTCTIDQKTGWCLGCGRTIKEISDWTKYTDQKRDDVMKALATRLSELRTLGKPG